MILETNKVIEIINNNDIKLIDLVVILDNKCNANCKICVAKQVIRHADCKWNCYGYKSTCVRCCDRNTTDEEFLSRIDDFFSSIHGKNIRVILTGGEPTLSNRLVKVIEIVKKYDFLSVAIETNGAGLLDTELSNTLLENDVTILLSRYGVDEISNANEFAFSTHVECTK